VWSISESSSAPESLKGVEDRYPLVGALFELVSLSFRLMLLSWRKYGLPTRYSNFSVILSGRGSFLDASNVCVTSRPLLPKRKTLLRAGKSSRSSWSPSSSLLEETSIDIIGPEDTRFWMCSLGIVDFCTFSRPLGVVLIWTMFDSQTYNKISRHDLMGWQDEEYERKIPSLMSFHNFRSDPTLNPQSQKRIPITQLVVR